MRKFMNGIKKTVGFVVAAVRFIGRQLKDLVTTAVNVSEAVVEDAVRVVPQEAKWWANAAWVDTIKPAAATIVAQLLADAAFRTARASSA